MKTSFSSLFLAGLAVPLYLSHPALQGAPPAPTGLKASDGAFPTAVQLEWDNAIGVEWEVWRGTESNSSKAVFLSDEWWNWHMDYSVSPGTVYYYWVRAHDDTGKSEFSQPDTGYAGEGSSPGDGYFLQVEGENGQVSKNPDMAHYPPGTQVTLTATPNEGYKFQGWYGTVTGAQNPITITMQANATVHAVFEQSVPQTGGSIRIVLEPAGAVQAGAQWRFADQTTWRNSGDKVENLSFGTYTVVLKDMAGWYSPPSKQVQVASNMPNVTWTLTYETQGASGYKLNLSAANGTIQKSPDQASYSSGAQVQLTALPSSGYRFDHWEGDASGGANPLTLIMDRDKTLQAVFLEETAAVSSIIIHLYAGITVKGTAGQKCRILATPDLAQSNSWVQVGELILTNQTQIWFDPTPAREQRRLYKVQFNP